MSSQNIESLEQHSAILMFHSHSSILLPLTLGSYKLVAPFRKTGILSNLRIEMLLAVKAALHLTFIQSFRYLVQVS